MITPEHQFNNLDIQALEAEVALTRQEIEEFRKLPKEEQEKQRDAKLEQLRDLQKKLEQAIQEAVKTGHIDKAQELKDKMKEGIINLENLLLNSDPDVLKMEFEAFIKGIYENWNSKDTVEDVKISIEIKSPRDEDYAAKYTGAGSSKVGQITLNPDTQGLDWEALKDKIFIPDLSSVRVKNLKEMAEYLIANFSDEYYFPGLEYCRYLTQNPDKVPDRFKDGNDYFSFGSLLNNNWNAWLVPNIHWDKSKLRISGDGLSNPWCFGSQVILLKKQ